MGPNIITPDQKESPKEICADMLQERDANLKLKKIFIKCDKTWIF